MPVPENDRDVAPFLCLTDTHATSRRLCRRYSVEPPVFLQRRYDRELYRVVALTYAGTVTLRYMLALYMWLNHAEGHFSLALWGDSGTYYFFGAAIAESWSHGNSVVSWTSTVEGKVNRGFIYVVACVYYLFGRNLILVQFLNGIIGALTPLVILELGLLLYNRRVATTAMLLTAFFPQMIFWSAALYKDPARLGSS